MKKLSKFTMIILMCGISHHTYAKDYPVVDFVNSDYKLDNKLLPKWARIVDSGELNAGFSLFKKTPKFEDLLTVQRAANRFEYRNDSDNYNVGDYWATPHEVDIAFGGDCEDIAIWKYAMLKRMGWAAEDMTMWAVGINNRKKNGSTLQHVILMVELDGKEYLLDSPMAWDDKVVPEPEEVTPEYMNAKFTFNYKFNENGWDVK